MKEIKTNYSEERYEYPLCNGEDKKDWVMYLKNSCRESNEDFFKRLIGYGYTNIKFYEVTTRVKGIHNVIAYVK